MDNLTICDRCGSDCCYIQEVNQDISNYQCMGCGFITNSLMKKDSQFFEEQMELLPNLYKNVWIWIQSKNFLKMSLWML